MVTEMQFIQERQENCLLFPFNGQFSEQGRALITSNGDQ